MEHKAEIVMDPRGGANQSRVRDHNERLVLSLVRRHENLSKAEIAKRSGLSAQTISVIMRALEGDGLLLRGEPQRGKVGQPSIPMRLDPEGVFSIGLKIGRRSADMVLIDFLGNELQSKSITFDYPTPKGLFEFADIGIRDLIEGLPVEHRSRIAGVGIAMPFELWNWAEKIGASESEMADWRAFNFQTELAAATGLPVFVQNDATSACGAELVFGRGTELSDFVYFFVGTFIGGGVVLNNNLFVGPTGNAGAFGAFPTTQEDGSVSTLIDEASVYTLETRMREAGIGDSPLWTNPEDWHSLGKLLDEWIATTAHHLARAAVGSCAMIDFQAAVVDGAFPDDIRKRLVAEIQLEVDKLDTRGIAHPIILEGQVGRGARALGGAGLPLFARYLLDQNVLFKETGEIT